MSDPFDSAHSTSSGQAQGKQKNLATKLAEIMALVERVPKNGWNDFHKYAFATESDVVEAVSKLMSERNITPNPNVVSYERRPKEGSAKGGFVTDIMVRWTLKDGDTGETEDSLVPGCGEDSGDKGCAKALTMSKKYFLTLRFMIPTGDDPERERGVPPTSVYTEERAAVSPAPNIGTPSPQQIRDYKLKPTQPAPQDGETWIEGELGTVTASEDGKCWFVKVGKTSMWTRDEDLAQGLAADHGNEVKAHGRMKPGGKSYQLISYVPKD